jgi:hypothetical protein
MVETGKNYRKGDPVRGAAILVLACELRGLADDVARDLVQGILVDLDVKEGEVRQYLSEHRDELAAILAAQPQPQPEPEA